MKLIALSFAGLLLAASVAHASPASDELMAKFKADGVTKADAAKGKADWTKEGKVKDGQQMSCSACHGTDLSKPGKHYKTGKVIEPMSQKANAERYTEVKKMEKWFKNNCKDVFERECTSQEKADFLTFLLAQ